MAPSWEQSGGTRARAGGGGGSPAGGVPSAIAADPDARKIIDASAAPSRESTVKALATGERGHAVQCPVPLGGPAGNGAE